MHKKIVDRKGAESCYVDYAPDFGTGPFAHYICTSVNDAVLHGIPFDYNLKDGDLVSLDLAISVNGWVGDSAISFVVGNDPDPSDLKLIKCTEEALAAGIDAARPGNRLGDVSSTIGDIARSYGYPINLEFGGHGTSPTTARPATATACARVWSSPSNRGSSRPPTRSTRTPRTAGRCVPRTGRVAPTASTRSPSPRTVRSS